MAPIREFLLSFLLTVVLTVRADLTMHQQHLKKHHENIQRKQSLPQAVSDNELPSKMQGNTARPGVGQTSSSTHSAKTASSRNPSKVSVPHQAPRRQPTVPSVGKTQQHFKQQEELLKNFPKPHAGNAGRTPKPMTGASSSFKVPEGTNQRAEFTNMPLHIKPPEVFNPDRHKVQSSTLRDSNLKENQQLKNQQLQKKTHPVESTQHMKTIVPERETNAAPPVFRSPGTSVPLSLHPSKGSLYPGIPATQPDILLADKIQQHPKHEHHRKTLHELPREQIGAAVTTMSDAPYFRSRGRPSSKTPAHENVSYMKPNKQSTTSQIPSIHKAQQNLKQPSEFKLMPTVITRGTTHDALLSSRGSAPSKMPETGKTFSAETHPHPKYAEHVKPLTQGRHPSDSLLERNGHLEHQALPTKLPEPIVKTGRNAMPSSKFPEAGKTHVSEKYPRTKQSLKHPEEEHKKKIQELKTKQTAGTTPVSRNPTLNRIGPSQVNEPLGKQRTKLKVAQPDETQQHHKAQQNLRIQDDLKTMHQGLPTAGEATLRSSLGRVPSSKMPEISNTYLTETHPQSSYVDRVKPVTKTPHPSGFLRKKSQHFKEQDNLLKEKQQALPAKPTEPITKPGWNAVPSSKFPEAGKTHVSEKYPRTKQDLKHPGEEHKKKIQELKTKQTAGTTPVSRNPTSNRIGPSQVNEPLGKQRTKLKVAQPDETQQHHKAQQNLRIQDDLKTMHQGLPTAGEATLRSSLGRVTSSKMPEISNTYLTETHPQSSYVDRGKPVTKTPHPSGFLRKKSQHFKEQDNLLKEKQQALPAKPTEPITKPGRNAVPSSKFPEAGKTHVSEKYPRTKQSLKHPEEEHKKKIQELKTKQTAGTTPVSRNPTLNRIDPSQVNEPLGKQRTKLKVAQPDETQQHHKAQQNLRIQDDLKTMHQGLPTAGEATLRSSLGRVPSSKMPEISNTYLVETHPQSSYVDRVKPVTKNPHPSGFLQKQEKLLKKKHQGLPPKLMRGNPHAINPEINVAASPKLSGATEKHFAETNLHAKHPEYSKPSLSPSSKPNRLHLDKIRHSTQQQEYQKRHRELPTKKLAGDTNVARNPTFQRPKPPSKINGPPKSHTSHSDTTRQHLEMVQALKKNKDIPPKAETDGQRSVDPPLDTVHEHTKAHKKPQTTSSEQKYEQEQSTDTSATTDNTDSETSREPFGIDKREEVEGHRQTGENRIMKQNEKRTGTVPFQNEASGTTRDHLSADSYGLSDSVKVGKETTTDSPAKSHPVSLESPRKHGEQQPDDEVIYIDGHEEDQKIQKTYPDSDLDNEDIGINDPAREGAREEDLTGASYAEKMIDHPVASVAEARRGSEGGLIRPLAYEDLESVLRDRHYVMMHFGCDTCEQFRQHFLTVARNFWRVEDDEESDSTALEPPITISFYEVTDPRFLFRFNFTLLPAVVFYRNGVPILYEGKLNADALQRWAFAHLDVVGSTLTEDNFDEKTKGARTWNKTAGKPWMVNFCNEYAQGCDRFMPTWESAASRLREEVMFGYVDTGVNTKLARQFRVDPKKIPAIALFKEGHTFWCTLPLQELSSDNLVHFFKEGHSKVQEETPQDDTPKPSMLSVLINIAGENIKSIVLAGVVIPIILSVAYIMYTRPRRKKAVRKPRKKDKGV